MDQKYLQERICATKRLIQIYEDALFAFTDPSVLEYLINTGQGSQRVTRNDTDKLQAALDGLYNRLAVLCNRYNGGNVKIARPAF